MTRESNQQQGCLFDAGKSVEPVLVSACLLGIPCRWHGAGRRSGKSLFGDCGSDMFSCRSALSNSGGCRRRERVKCSTARALRCSMRGCESLPRKPEKM